MYLKNYSSNLFVFSSLSSSTLCLLRPREYCHERCRRKPSLSTAVSTLGNLSGCIADLPVFHTPSEKPNTKSQSAIFRAAMNQLGVILLEMMKTHSPRECLSSDEKRWAVLEGRTRRKP